jgi:hypothetical protein
MEALGVEARLGNRAGTAELDQRPREVVLILDVGVERFGAEFAERVARLEELEHPHADGNAVG